MNSLDLLNETQIVMISKKQISQSVFLFVFAFLSLLFFFMSSVTNVPFKLLKENPVLKCDCCSDLGGLSQGATRAKAERGQMFH